MTFVVTFRFRGKTEVQERRLASSLKIDGKGALILYDKNRGIMDNLMLGELSDFSIEAYAARQPRSFGLKLKAFFGKPANSGATGAAEERN
jgi:hypothetical protein